MDQSVRAARFRTVNPDLAILPVFRFNTAEGRIIKSLGTAFFFSVRPTILSVKHVLGVQPGPDEAIVVPRQRPPYAESGAIKPYEEAVSVTNVRTDPRQDLAVAEVPGVTHLDYFPLCREDPPAGAPNVMTYDLASRITAEAFADRDPAPTITPYVWKGYVHAVRICREPLMPAAAKILEVSIPTVRGMSGAPLIEERTMRVLGVLFGNYARQVEPSPLAKTEDQRWYLPVGQALHWSHVRSFLDSLGLEDGP